MIAIMIMKNMMNMMSPRMSVYNDGCATTTKRPNKQSGVALALA